jgi:hypothetical protein
MSNIFRRNAAKGLAGLMVVVSLFMAEGSRGARSASAGEAAAYKWNVAEKGLPLLGLNRDRLQPGFAQSLTYPFQGACSV